MTHAARLLAGLDEIAKLPDGWGDPLDGGNPSPDQASVYAARRCILECERLGVPLDAADVDPDAMGGVSLLLYNRALTREIWVACNNGGTWCMIFSAKDSGPDARPAVSGATGTTPEASRALEFLS